MDPDDTPEPDQASMPPDPFTPVDDLFTVVYAEFCGLRRAGASLAEAALITAAHVAVNGIVNQDSQPPGGQPPAA